MKTSKTIFRTLAVVLIAGLLFSCNGKQSIFPEGNDIFGVAFPIKMQDDNTVIYLSDILLPHAMDKEISVKGHSAYNISYNKELQAISIVAKTKNPPHLSELTITVDEVDYALILQRSRLQNITFKFDPQGERYRSVKIAGELNDWDPNKTNLTLIDGIWQANLKLNPGNYQYQIVVDGNWILDPNNPVKVDNNIGGLNSLLEVSGDSDNKPFITTSSYKKGDILITSYNDPKEIFVLWNNFKLPAENVSGHDNHLHITIPGDAYKTTRSFLRVFAYNDNGIGNDLLIPLEKGQPLKNPANLTRQDKEATILYFMMVDRFKNGNTDNDDPVDDPDVFPRANYFGGDLRGIVKKIEDGYFSNLGINTIWLSPITQNPLEAYVEYPAPHRKYTGYHGYWPITLTTIDHRFGNENDMNDMVSSAHGRNINVMLDFVSNHVHEKNPLFIENPDWATQLNLDDGRTNIRIWDEHRLTTWFDTFLPSLDFSKQEVIDVMSDSAFFWVERYNLDGFRHDATKHIPNEFWRTLTQKLRDNFMHPNTNRLFQIGETFGSRELIGSYVGNGLLDGQFDFNLYFDARSVFALDNESFKKLDFSLQQSFSYYGYNNLMGNITGNHDLPRFISLAGGALRFDEDDKESGWQREVGVGEQSGYDKLSQITAFIMTIPGVPVIYYGDEIGLPGAGDPDSRRPMKFENLTPDEQKVKDNATKLCNLRTSNLAFIYGDFQTLKVTDEVYVYARSYFDNQAIVFFNKAAEAQTITVDLPNRFAKAVFTTNFGSSMNVSNNSISITVKPFGFDVLTAK